MASVMNPIRPSPVRRPRQAMIVGVAVVATALGLLFIAQRLTPSKSFVARLTVVNPTPYHLEVDVRGTDEAPGVALGPVGRELSREFHDVIDQGRQWTFVFKSGGSDGGQLQVLREQLERDRWRVTVPPDVAQRLAAAGVPQSPRE